MPRLPGTFTQLRYTIIVCPGASLFTPFDLTQIFIVYARNSASRKIVITVTSPLRSYAYLFALFILLRSYDRCDLPISWSYAPYIFVTPYHCYTGLPDHTTIPILRCYALMILCLRSPVTIWSLSFRSYALLISYYDHTLLPLIRLTVIAWSFPFIT